MDLFLKYLLLHMNINSICNRKVQFNTTVLLSIVLFLANVGFEVTVDPHFSSEICLVPFKFCVSTLSHKNSLDMRYLKPKT